MKILIILSAVFICNYVLVAAGSFAPESMAYVLQTENLGTRKAAVAKLAKSGSGLIVIDFAYDGSSEGKWTKSEIDNIRAGKKGRKVVAYISIGEAEDYRRYWRKSWDKNKDGVPDKGAPPFLNSVNPDWEGNYKVRYWNKEWQKIILKYIDEIIAQDFDGVYLDIVDGFEFYEHDKKTDKWVDNRKNPDTGNTYRQDMIDWVKKIAFHSRKVKPGFLLIPQNGCQLAENDDYVSIISAIGIEDVFTLGNKKQPEEHVKYLIPFLKKIQKMKKVVLIIEYPTKKRFRKISKQGVKKNDFVLLITDRELRSVGLSKIAAGVRSERSDGAKQIDVKLSGSLQNPASSPDSKSILFTRWRKRYNSEKADLFIYNLQTSSLHKLISNNSANVNLPGSSWNKQINKIIFSSDRDPHDEIFMIDPDGKTGDEIKITDQKKRMSYEPSFSPDGKWVVFESHPLDVEGNGVITKCKVKGKKKYLSLTDIKGDCRQPNWSPNGKHILYQKNIKDQWDIWMMNSDGTDHRKITKGKGSKTDATFSPDGKWIVYSSDGNGELRFANIYATNLKSGKTLRITEYKGYDGAPSWSADGEIIFFESTKGDPDRSKGTTLWMIGADEKIGVSAGRYF